MVTHMTHVNIQFAHVTDLKREGSTSSSPFLRGRWKLDSRQILLMFGMRDEGGTFTVEQDLNIEHRASFIRRGIIPRKPHSNGTRWQVQPLDSMSDFRDWYLSLLQLFAVEIFVSRGQVSSQMAQVGGVVLRSTKTTSGRRLVTTTLGGRVEPLIWKFGTSTQKSTFSFLFSERIFAR